MANPIYKPLNYPKVWPPSDLPPASPESFEYKMKHIPILGWVVAYIIWLFRWRRFRQEVLNPIEDEIVVQLDARGTIENWYKTQKWLNNPTKQKIGLIISEAIGLEKPVESPPPLYPEDPFGPLFWGPFDDLTPLIVDLEIQKEFGCRIPNDGLIAQAWNEQWTIEKLIEYYDQQISQHAERK
ncbi:hypothetical protein [Gimesia aquarii]|uniref:Uncharacterized protein n=1 Tax=Gimesia aquarii TaxID=2527964 RepID=A0A517VTA2_9PLAN|nr:hypothetical protein [Gimesia aquarii]QDT96244.1 hypothetical protein V144x_16970 [Gimesia aquarii]